MQFDKYEKLGAYHWDEYERQTQYGQHANYVKNWVRIGHTLDVGCGDGLITSLLDRDAFNTCIGVDDNQTAIDLAEEKGVINVFNRSAYNLEGLTGFDSVYLGDVIEHLEFPEKALCQIKKALKPDGILYLVTPPALPTRKMQDPYHYFEWTPEEMELFMHANGWQLETLTVNPNHVRMYATFKIIK